MTDYYLLLTPNFVYNDETYNAEGYDRPDTKLLTGLEVKKAYLKEVISNVKLILENDDKENFEEELELTGYDENSFLHESHMDEAITKVKDVFNSYDLTHYLPVILKVTLP